MNQPVLHELEAAFADRNTFLLVLLGALSWRRKATRWLRHHVPRPAATPGSAEPTEPDVILLALLGGVSMLERAASADVGAAIKRSRRRKRVVATRLPRGLLR